MKPHPWMLALVAIGCSPGADRDPADRDSIVLGEWTWNRLGGSEVLALRVDPDPDREGSLRIHATRKCCLGFFEEDRTATWDGTTLLVKEPRNQLFGFRSALHLHLRDGNPYLVSDERLDGLLTGRPGSSGFAKKGIAYEPEPTDEPGSRNGLSAGRGARSR